MLPCGTRSIRPSMLRDSPTGTEVMTCTRGRTQTLLCPPYRRTTPTRASGSRRLTSNGPMSMTPRRLVGTAYATVVTARARRPARRLLPWAQPVPRDQVGAEERLALRTLSVTRLDSPRMTRSGWTPLHRQPRPPGHERERAQHRHHRRAAQGGQLGVSELESDAEQQQPSRQ
jgi:hypothetical protein